jgi:hypothetical protein
MFALSRVVSHAKIASENEIGSSANSPSPTHPLYARREAAEAVIARRDASEQGRQKHRVPLLGLIISGIFAILVCDAVAIGAEESNAQRVDRLKAGYLLNFVRFVDWPASGSANVLTVCFVGGQTVLDALASGIENKTAGERHLAARMLSESEPPLGCNVLYLEASTMRDSAHALNLGDMPILTVSDAKDFARSGGMI